jgi:hypothetical protein
VPNLRKLGRSNRDFADPAETLGVECDTQCRRLALTTQRSRFGASECCLSDCEGGSTLIANSKKGAEQPVIVGTDRGNVPVRLPSKESERFTD